MAVLLLLLAVSSGCSQAEETPQDESTTTSTSAPTEDPDVAPPGAPTAGAAADRSAIRAAQSRLRNAITAAKVISTDYEGRFEKDAEGNPIDPETLAAEESSLRFGESGTASTEVIAVIVGAGTKPGEDPMPNSEIFLITASAPDSFFCIHASSDGSVSFGTGSDEMTAMADCNKDRWPPV